MLIGSIILITLALVFYTLGVWAEKLKGTLKPWHVIVFWIGFTFDTLATTGMSLVAKANAAKALEEATNVAAVSSTFNLHAVSGVLAILLMLFHAVWATVVIRGKNQKQKESFHKFSLVVWLIWLIPYISGMLAR